MWKKKLKNMSLNKDRDDKYVAKALCKTPEDTLVEKNQRQTNLRSSIRPSTKIGQETEIYPK